MRVHCGNISAGARLWGETLSALKQIEINACRAVGVGVSRPEDVVVSRDGDVWLSDQASACARIKADGSLARTGRAGGAPNGINMDAQGRILIANFGGPEDGSGPLQRLDPDSGEVEILCAEIDGRHLYGSNYPIVDRAGRIWCSHSTWGPVEAAFEGLNDGLVFRYDPDGSVHVVAEDLKLGNGLALDFDEQYLYVCETTACDVLRYPIAADGSLGASERYGPKLGFTSGEVQCQRPLSLEMRSQIGLTDGCGFDCEGNLWVTLVLANKIIAIRPNGEVVTMLSDPTGDLMRNPTNVSWGGKGMDDLYIGSVATDYVVHVKSPIPGMPLIHQR